MKTAKDFIRKNLRHFIPYDAHVKSDVISLNANENPYNLCETLCNRYPEPQPKALRELLANLYGASEEEIVMTSGADQAIDMLIRTLLESGKDSQIITHPTFSMYGFYAEVQGALVHKVPLREDSELDVEEIIKVQADTGAKLVFIANPTAPLGNVLDRSDILDVIKSLQGKAIVVVDEAYIEFSKEESFVKYRKDYDNLVVLRTLSKYYAFAGLRIGCLIADKELAHTIRAVMSPFVLSVLSVRLAEEVLSSPTSLSKADEMAGKLIKARILLENELAKLPYVRKMYNTSANFVFFEINGDPDNLKNFCEERNVLIRSFKSQVEGGVRISIGNDLEMQELIKVLKEYQG